MKEIALWEVVHTECGEALKRTKDAAFIFFIRTEPVFFPYNRFIQGFMRLWPQQNCNSILTYSFFYFP